MTERRESVANYGRPVCVGTCATQGCNATVFGEEHCSRCQEEIDALDAMALRGDWRREARRACFARIGRAVRERLWILNLAFVGVSLMYVGYVYGALFLTWLEAQQ